MAYRQQPADRFFGLIGVLDVLNNASRLDLGSLIILVLGATNLVLHAVKKS